MSIQSTRRPGRARPALSRRALLAGGGMPAFRQSLMLSIASVIRHGFLAGTGDDLPSLLGGAPTDPLAVAAEVMAARPQRHKT